MTHFRSLIVGWCALLAGVHLALGAPPPAPPEKPTLGDNVRDAQALAAKIDQSLTAGWDKPPAVPAPLSDDAEFMRRVYLEIAGRTPAVSEVRTFLADPAPDKRQRLV